VGPFRLSLQRISRGPDRLRQVPRAEHAQRRPWMRPAGRSSSGRAAGSGLVRASGWLLLTRWAEPDRGPAADPPGPLRVNAPPPRRTCSGSVDAALDVTRTRRMPPLPDHPGSGVRWQRLPAFGDTGENWLLTHLDGILGLIAREGSPSGWSRPSRTSAPCAGGVEATGDPRVLAPKVQRATADSRRLRACYEHWGHANIPVRATFSRPPGGVCRVVR